MPDSLYERDALAWAEQQAELLGRVAAGERLNTMVDWPHVIEEVQEVGLSELCACQSLLQQAIMHLLKLWAWPGSPAASHWRVEAGTFLDDAARRFTPSMRQRLGLDGLYAAARRRVAEMTDDAGEPRGLPEACPFTLEELLAGNVAELVAGLSGSRSRRR